MIDRIHSVQQGSITTHGSQVVARLNSLQRHDKVRLSRLSGPTSIREFVFSDCDIVCDWVRSQEELALISSDRGRCLSPEILTRWTKTSDAALVLADQFDNPIAFCTLSRSESEFLDVDLIEICHLIVAPRQRYLVHAARFLHAACNHASEMTYSHVVGRIVPHNYPAVALALYCGFTENLPSHLNLATGFRWFYRSSNITSETRRSCWRNRIRPKTVTSHIEV